MLRVLISLCWVWDEMMEEPCRFILFVSFWFWYVSTQVIQGHSGAFSSFLPHVLFSLLLRIITFSLSWSSSRCGSLPKCEIGNLLLVPCLQIWEFSCWLLWGMKEEWRIPVHPKALHRLESFLHIATFQSSCQWAKMKAEPILSVIIIYSVQ